MLSIPPIRMLPQWQLPNITAEIPQLMVAEPNIWDDIRANRTLHELDWLVELSLEFSLQTLAGFVELN